MVTEPSRWPQIASLLYEIQKNCTIDGNEINSKNAIVLNIICQSMIGPILYRSKLYGESKQFIGTASNIHKLYLIDGGRNDERSEIAITMKRCFLLLFNRNSNIKTVSYPLVFLSYFEGKRSLLFDNFKNFNRFF